MCVNQLLLITIILLAKCQISTLNSIRDALKVIRRHKYRFYGTCMIVANEHQHGRQRMSINILAFLVYTIHTIWCIEIKT